MGQEFVGHLYRSDEDRDICAISVPELKVAPVQIGSAYSLEIGERVFAIGSPRGLETTLSEGIISGKRSIGSNIYIQTTAPISPGSSGGGLFDAHGKLVGLPAFFLRDGQQLNFALPVEWVKELLEGDVSDHLSNQLGAGRGHRHAHPWLAEMSDRLSDKILDSELRQQILETVQEESSRTALLPALVLAMIDVLSGFDLYASSEAGGRGLMQVAPSWLDEIGHPDHDLFRIKDNIRFGCTILRYYLDLEEGHLTNALQRYRGARNKEFSIMVFRALKNS